MAAPLRRLAPAHEPDDAELVLRAREGDRWAEEMIYRRHVGRLTAIAARLLRHGADVEDVVQETFLAAYADLEALREPARLGAWLARSMVHRCHKRFRRRRVRRLLGLEVGRDEPLEAQAKAGTSPELRAELALLDRALDGLGDADRICWVLRVLEGHPLADVAELAGCSLATAKRRIARAQAHLARHAEGTPSTPREEALDAPA
ncbi:MAG: sigma-70 family RNA polymerase sigma factor [Myxococcota bacterium]